MFDCFKVSAEKETYYIVMIEACHHKIILIKNFVSTNKQLQKLEKKNYRESQDYIDHPIYGIVANASSYNFV
jgi:hypothetical protein